MEMVIALPTVLQQVVTAREFPCERCFTNPSLVEVDDNSPLTQNVTASTFFDAMHRNQLLFYYWLLVCYEPAILTISRDYGYFLRGRGGGIGILCQRVGVFKQYDLNQSDCNSKLHCRETSVGPIGPIGGTLRRTQSINHQTIWLAKMNSRSYCENKLYRLYKGLSFLSRAFGDQLSHR